MGEITTKQRSGNPSKQGGFSRRWRCLVDSAYRAEVTAQSARHRELVSLLKDRIAVEVEEVCNKKLGALDTTSNKKFVRQLEQVGFIRGQLPNFIGMLESYSVPTLEVISEHVTGETQLYSLLHGLEADSPELLVRERAVFPLSRNHEGVMSLLRDMTGLNDLSESVRDADLLRKIRAVVIFMQMDSLRRSMALPDKVAAYKSILSAVENLTGAKVDFYQGHLLTASLAQLVMDNPFRIEDILDYMENRDLNITTVDPGHLREYLALPATVFGDGVL